MAQGKTVLIPGGGNFYAEPAPQTKLKQAGHLLHWGKVAYEKYWFYKWFQETSMTRA